MAQHLHLFIIDPNSFSFCCIFVSVSLLSILFISWESWDINLFMPGFIFFGTLFQAPSGKSNEPHCTCVRSSGTICVYTFTTARTYRQTYPDTKISGIIWAASSLASSHTQKKLASLIWLIWSQNLLRGKIYILLDTKQNKKKNEKKPRIDKAPQSAAAAIFLNTYYLPTRSSAEN